MDSVTTGVGGGADVDPSGSSEWDDVALAAATFTTSAASTRNATSALGSLSMADSSSYGGALHHNNPYFDPDNIAEKLRVEETKAALAAAREGMEREAQKLAEEKERKRQEALGQAAAAGATPGGAGLGGGRWVPSHMRGSAGGGSLRARMMGGGSQNLDVADEELFPDLASADKMLADKEAAEKKRAAMAVSKPITAMSGATWASRMAAKKTERDAAVTTGAVAKKVEVPAAAAEPVPPEPDKEAAPEVAPVEPEKDAAPDTDTSQPAVAKKVVKKKKKDLSTFKTGGAS